MNTYTPPAIENQNALKPECTVEEPIKKNVGDTVALNGGRDYDSPRARVVPSTYRHAEDHEKAIHISQGKNTGVSLSLATLKKIVEWAETEGTK